MLCLSGFELYSRWVPLMIFRIVHSLSLCGGLRDTRAATWRALPADGGTSPQS